MSYEDVVTKEEMYDSVAQEPNKYRLHFAEAVRRLKDCRDLRGGFTPPKISIVDSSNSWQADIFIREQTGSFRTASGGSGRLTTY